MIYKQLYSVDKLLACRAYEAIRLIIDELSLNLAEINNKYCSSKYSDFGEVCLGFPASNDYGTEIEHIIPIERKIILTAYKAEGDTQEEYTIRILKELITIREELKNAMSNI